MCSEKPRGLRGPWRTHEVIWSLGPTALASGSAWPNVVSVGETQGPHALHLQADISSTPGVWLEAAAVPELSVAR